MKGPEGVRLHRSDGTVIGCELIYDGVDDEGINDWLIAGVEFHPELGDTISIEVLPPKCGIGFYAPGLKPDG